MIFNYIKIWLLDSKKNMSYLSFFEKIIEYLIYFVLLNLVLNNIYLSLILLFLIIFVKYIYKNIYILKQLINTNDFIYILLKPVNPIFRILIYGANPIDLIVSILIIIIFCASFPSKLLLVFGVLIILFALYLLVLSLTLFINYKLPIEKILPIVIFSFLLAIFNNSLIGLTSLMGILSILLFAISLLFLSFKLWNYLLKNFL